MASFKSTPVAVARHISDIFFSKMQHNELSQYRYLAGVSDVAKKFKISLIVKKITLQKFQVNWKILAKYKYE